MGEEQIIRLSIEGTEIVLKATKEILVFAVAVLKGAWGNRAAQSAKELLKNTSAVRFLSMSNKDADIFKAEAKKMHIKFCHLKDNDGDGNSSFMLRNEDGPLINRIIERSNIGLLDDSSVDDITKNPDKAKNINEYTQIKDVIE